MENSSVKEVGDSLNQHCALVANGYNFTVICLSKDAASRLREWILPL